MSAGAEKPRTSGRGAVTVRKIEKLTAEQVAQIPSIRDEFLRIGLSTTPADFDATERAIKDSYAVAGLAPPKIFIRVASPHEGAIAAAILGGTQFGGARVRARVRAQVRAQVGDQVWALVRAQVRAQAWAQVWAQVLDQVWDQVGAPVRDQVLDQVWDQVGAQVWDQIGGQIGGQIGAAFYSQHEAGWLAWASYFRRVVGLPGTEKVEALARIAANCGWVWFFEGAAIMTDRPRILRRDENNRLHCETGPALEYRDGFAIYAWHGTRLPAEWVENRATIDPAEILKAPNVEQRSAGAAMLGWPRMVSKLNREIIDGDPDSDVGALIELTMPGLLKPGRFLQAVCVRNGPIVEGVPRTSDIDGRPIETAMQAQAWRVGLTPAEYRHPIQRS